MSRFTLQSTVAAAALFMMLGAGNATAADVSAAPYNWSGFYVGGLVGYGNTHTEADFAYENTRRSLTTVVSPMNAILPDAGWARDEFFGDVYTVVASLNAFSFDYPYHNDPAPAVAQWPGSLSDNAGSFAGTALGGYNFQVGDFIIGAELRAAFGDFGNSNAWSATSGGTKTGYADHEGTLNFADPGQLLVPADITPADMFEGVNFSAIYSQDASLKAGTEFNSMFSPVARAGFAIDRVQFFGMAGPTYANVKATTSATISESLTGFTDTPISAPINFTADKTYRFSGSNTENMWGFTVGGGSEWAVTDNVILRVEGEYHNLGDITVRGTSADTEASYKVKQTIDGYTISTGVMLKL